MAQIPKVFDILLSFKNIVLRKIRRSKIFFELKLITKHDEKYITVLTENFHYKRPVLKEIAEKVEIRNKMVEIGSFAGFSTRVFSCFFKKVISVDPYLPGYDSYDINSSKFRLQLAQDLFTLRFLDDPGVEQIRKTSEEASKKFVNGELDFVYIDASHKYEDVKKDIELWKPKLKAGAFMAGDDYNWPGVKKAVMETLKGHKVYKNIWFKKINDPEK